MIGYYSKTLPHGWRRERFELFRGCIDGSESKTASQLISGTQLDREFGVKHKEKGLGQCRLIENVKEVFRTNGSSVNSLNSLRTLISSRQPSKVLHCNQVLKWWIIRVHLLGSVR